MRFYLPFRNQRTERYLLIKRLGAGFWADIDHVIGQLAASEIMKRTPVVDWGLHGPYADGVNETFGLYFRPVSNLLSGDLPGEYYPKYWNSKNITSDLPFKSDSRPHSTYRYPASMISSDIISLQKEHILKRHRRTKYLRWNNEAVIVSICHESLAHLTKLRSRNSSIYGLSETDARRNLVKKYLHVQRPIQDAINNYIAQIGLRYAALHLRGGDKILEDTYLHQKNHDNLELAANWLQSNADCKLFLLTDSINYLKICADRFGPRLATRQVSRSDDISVPSFMNKSMSGYRNGVDVVIDTYIAAKAEIFFGNDESNVAKFVTALR